ncbi:MAG: S-adenosylmethionine:tRNA ribosyltransferase-isomerase [Acidimicrobiaceae bacterium]
MDTADLDYDLPAGAIAQVPAEPRDSARLLVDRGPSRRPEHRRVADLADLLRPGDLLVVNDTRVRAARLRLHKPTGGEVEVLLLEELDGGDWDALVRPSRKVRPGTVLTGSGGDGLSVEVGDDLGGGRRRVTVTGDPSASGEVPLPPYIHTALRDPERYQTVYARRPRSAAAPTAGLHLTDAVLDRCRAKGVAVASVELAVGLDTFKPLTVEHLEDHVMHSEAFTVSADVMGEVDRASRVVAVGTTVVRALESAAASGRLEGRTDLFITPGFEFKAVDVLMTNFHVPRTSLLALIAAFIGPRWRDVYALALAEGYRFLSFGDAMLLERSPA